MWPKSKIPIEQSSKVCVPRRTDSYHHALYMYVIQYRLKKYPKFCSLLNWRGYIQEPSSNPSSSVPSCCMFPIVTEVLRHGATSVGGQELQGSCLNSNLHKKSPCPVSKGTVIYFQVEGFFPELHSQIHQMQKMSLCFLGSMFKWCDRKGILDWSPKNQSIVSEPLRISTT